MTALQPLKRNHPSLRAVPDSCLFTDFLYLHLIRDTTLAILTNNAQGSSCKEDPIYPTNINGSKYPTHSIKKYVFYFRPSCDISRVAPRDALVVSAAYACNATLTWRLRLTGFQASSPFASIATRRLASSLSLISR